ncbi:MAG: GDSL-type esterase/lipase family protein [Castellaniella sp.]|uniref:GDSL-type esterase/lipase family protein n=1 Tax=Castellaniella sp. TaxID=1955812 RepID=UPI003C7696C8
MKNSLRLLVLPLLAATLLTTASCQTRPPDTIPASAAGQTDRAAVRAPGLQDFGDPNAARLADRYRLLAAAHRARTRAEPSILTVIQLGDSHTASDTLTADLRTRLQADLGDAGIGWITPMNVRGMSHLRLKTQSRQWHLSSSRTDENPDFPLGGYIATPDKPGATIRVESRQADAAPYLARVLIQTGAAPDALTVDSAGGRQLLAAPSGPTHPPGSWQTVHVPVRLPFTITARHTQAVALGGIQLIRQRAQGALVSPIGSNGARQTIWDRWSPDWLSQLADTQADLIILAYGTNEAFDETLNPEAMRNSLTQGIRSVRRALPQAAILLIGSPDAMVVSSDPSLACAARRPTGHDVVKRIQLDVAQAERTLYWDWQQAMGRDDCPMLAWQQRDWVGRDLVHFTLAGYQESARRLYLDLSRFLRRDPASP